MCARTWRKSAELFRVSPRAIADLLHGSFPARSENAQAARIAQVLGCSTNTARAMLRGEGAGKEFYPVIIAVCGWDAFVRAVARRRAA